MITHEDVSKWHENPLMKTDHSSWVKLDPRGPTPDGGYNWMYDYTLQKWIPCFSDKYTDTGLLFTEFTEIF